MLHTTSPGSKPGRRTSSGAATALSARNISGASISGNRANGHSRAASDSRDLLHHVHKSSGPDSPSLSALSPSPPPSHHPPKKPSSLPDPSNAQPGGFDTLSVDSASVASADSGGQPRVRRLCSPENSRRPFIPPPCRQSTYPRSSSQSKDSGGAYTGRLTEQALRDQEAVQRNDLDDPVPKTHAAPYQTINSTPQKFTSQSFREDTIMTSSTPEEYGGNVRTSRDRSRSLASTHSDPIRKTEDGAEIGVQGTMSSKTLGNRPERSQFGHKSSASMGMGFGNHDDNGDGKFSQPTMEGSREKVRSTEGNGDSISGNKPISASTASSQGVPVPFRNITIRAEEKARSAQEHSDNHGKQHLGSPSNASRHGSSVGTAAGTISALRTTPRANSLPKDSKAPRQATSTLSSPSPDQQLSRRDKGHISKPDISPTAAKQQSQKPSHKRNATTTSISRTFPSERGVGKARDERNRSSSAASARGTTARGKPTSQSVSTTSTMEAESPLEVAPSEALVTDANLEQPILVETLGDVRKESPTSRSSSASDWRTDCDSEPGADFSSRKLARDKQRNSGASSTNESTLNASNYKDLSFEAHAQESSPQSFLKRPSEDDYEDLKPASRAGNVQTSRYTPTPSPSKRRDTRKKNMTIPRGLRDIKLARKSPLEEEDSDVDSLQYLMDNDQDFSALFSPVDDEEDDTALLLASLPTYKPPAAQKLKVRPRAEAEAGDQLWEQERALREKLTNRLRTLQLEVRSANRGLEVLESHLDGTESSGDLSECWDDAAQRKEYMRRLRKEEQKQRLILERRMRQKVALLGTPLPWSKWLVKWGFIAFLVVIVWYLLELAVFLHSMPPSYSSVAIERKPPPEFGALFSHTILRLAKFIFNSSAWLIQHGSIAIMNLTSTFSLAIIGSCKAAILNTLLYSWRVVTAIAASLSPSSSSAGGASEAVRTAVVEYADVAASGMPQALGSDQVIN